MRIGLVGHASIVVDTGAVRILSDPWWSGPCFGTQWWIHPDPCLDLVRAKDPDFIYISHGHHDHLHFGTLQRLPKTAKVLVSGALSLAGDVRAAGFEVVELEPRVPREVAPGVRVEITPTHGGDSYMVVGDGTAACLNLNDALHAAPESVIAATTADLRARYGRLDYVFCGYGIASHFPVCFEIPGRDPDATVARRQAMFNRRWAHIVRLLDPRMAFPFAADVVFFDEDLFWSNEPVHNRERPTDVFERLRGPSTTQVFDIAPGFVIDDGVVIADHRFAPVDNKALAAGHKDDMVTANRVTKPTAEQVADLIAILVGNLRWTKRYLLELRRSYAFLIVLKGADSAIEIRKSGADITVRAVPATVNRGDYDVVYTTRYSYLRRSLSTPFGYEVLFVGSGGIFTYRNAHDIDANLHRELAVMLRAHGAPQPSRFGEQPEALYRLKRAIRAVIGRTEPDLYDLRSWTVAAPEARARTARPHVR